MEFNPVRSSRAGGPEGTHDFVASATSNGVNPSIFKAYDIRGTYGKDFDDDFAFRLGQALVKYVNRKKFLVANDDRPFSPKLAEALMSGVTNSGGDVQYLGLSTTPLFNFVFKLLGVNGGVMITASHNPQEYGGFKVFGEEGRNIGLDTGLLGLKDLMISGNFEVSKYGGRVNNVGGGKILDRYADFILKKAKLGNAGAKVKFKIDAPLIAREEVSLVLRAAGLNSVETEYDISFVLDADADRISVFDGSDGPIHSDYICGLLIKNEINFWHKPKAVVDLRFSRGVREKFGEWRIECFRSRVGRAFLKENIVKYKADIAGELSGHIFWKEAGYNELPLLTMLKIVKIMGRTGKGIKELVEPFRTWENSGEINIATSNKRQATSVLEKLKERCGNGKIDELDGVTVE